jgi:hypothetical protein
MSAWAAVKRILYRLVPLLAYVDRLEDEVAALKSQRDTLQGYVLEMTKRAYFPDSSPLSPAEPASIPTDDLRTYVERRERQTLNAHLKGLGFADLAEYERSLTEEPAPTEGAR